MNVKLMKNIFREILKELPITKIQIVPDEPKDKEIANQMSALIHWKMGHTEGMNMEWISVKERFPSNEDDVLVINDEGRMSVSCYFNCGYMWMWECRDDQIGLGDITYWMPLPTPPEKPDN